MEAVLESDSDEERALTAEALLRERVPDRDARYDQVLTMVDELRDDPALTSVAALAARHALSERTVQRLFRRYVGVGPPEWSDAPSPNVIPCASGRSLE